MSDAEGTVGVLRDVIALARKEQIVLTAASLAYFTFISLVPVLLLLVVAVSVIGDSGLTFRVVSRATLALAPGNAALLTEIVFNAADRQRATVISAVVLVWGSLLTFRALNTSFAGIYGTFRGRSIRETVLDVVLVLVVIVAAVVAMVAAGVGVSMFVEVRLWNLLGPFVLWGVLVVVFFPLYYILPDVDVGPREALPGTVVAAGAWAALQAVFGYYTAISVTSQLYGAASAFFLILLWLYVGGLVLLVGAVLNAVLADRADPDAEWASLGNS